jgi:hypothetical protein
MNFFWIQFVPLMLVGIFLLLTLGVAIFGSKRMMRGRKNPIIGDLLRNPGESLRPQVDDLTIDILGLASGLFVGPLFLYSHVITISYFTKKPPSHFLMVIMIVIGLAFVGYLAVRIIKLMGKRNKLRLGLDCEMAVGQELNQLMLHGCRVYHDFPADNFNIDHVVIGPAGVYAVETKGRAKPDKVLGADGVRVVYDGKSLQFPGWSETEPIAQAKRQAQWLANWLTSAVGQPIVVKPALALPGWYVDRKERDMVVFNSKNSGFLAKSLDGTVLPADLIQSIAHQVEQRCRTVEPFSYRKKKKE